MILGLLVSLLFALATYLAVYFWKRIEKQKFREKLGLTGPPPHFLYGNFDAIFERIQKLGFDEGHELHLEWHEKYGDTFGMYVGGDLAIITRDEEMMKEVFIKQFHNFADRSIYGLFKENSLNYSLLQVTADHGWKDSRSTISPTFTTGKMKAMHETIHGKIDEFIKILGERADLGNPFDIYDDYQALTLDVIGKCAFAIESNCQRDRSDVFYVQVRKFFKYLDVQNTPMLGISMLFPEFTWLWKVLYPFTQLNASERPLVGGLSDVYDRRKKGEGSESVDVLKLLLNKENDETKPLSKQEVVENCFGFLLAGYETTSTALTFCTYLLARHQDVQEKLQAEIDRTHTEKGLNFDSVHAMKYLDAVYKESLRMYPPVIFFVARTCVEDTVVCGMSIPKGTHFTAVSHSVHMDEKNWESPREFQPDRFLDWNDKGSLKWIPFGLGPRFCVGMRFAEMEFKMTLVHLLHKFHLELPPNAPELKSLVNGVIMRPRNPVRVILTRRG